MEDGFEEEGPFPAWLPPDDRLWRHPSELGNQAVAARAGRSHPRVPEFRLWAVAVVAGLIGASLAAGVGVATGRYHSTTVHPIERVIEQPTTATLVSKSSTVSALQLASQVRASVVELDVHTAAGDTLVSGVIFRSDGSVITDEHALVGVKSISGVLPDGKRVHARVLGGDPETDIAVVKLGTSPLPVATLDTAASPQPGQMTVAVGSSPAGTQVASGVVRTVKGSLNANSQNPLVGLIEFDAQVDPMAIGGALLNANGAVVGITTGAFGTQPGPTRKTPSPAISGTTKPASVGYAVPIGTAINVADQILATGRVAHSWLGVRGTDTTSAMNSHLEISGGAFIKVVVARSPAARAGLRKGDVVTAVGDDPVTSMDDLIGALRQVPSGQRVTLTLLRQGHPRTAVVTLGRQPANLG